MKRSISMPVKPRFIDELPPLERSEEKEELFENYPSKSSLPSVGNEILTHYDQIIGADEYETALNKLPDFGTKSKVHVYSTKKCPYTARVIAQAGHQNINSFKIPGRSWQYFKDLITTLIEQKWSYTFLLFMSTFFFIWFLFTALWYLIAYAHGDLQYDEQSGERLSEGKHPCVIGAHSMTGLFIYTVETLVSIGFGEKYPSDECPEGVFLFVSQLIVYIGVEGAMVGIVYAKVARPSKQVSKPKFSKKAVICQRDGQFCLIIRVCDKKSQQAIGTKLRLSLLEDKNTLEGEYLGKCETALKIENNDTPFILWPTTVCHFIDRESPFYKYSPDDFSNKEYEVIVSLTGSSPSTGQITESRTSYLPREIIWGERFVNIIHYNLSRNVYTIDYDNFNSTISVSIPYCSAYQSQHITKSLAKKSYSK